MARWGNHFLVCTSFLSLIALVMWSLQTLKLNELKSNREVIKYRTQEFATSSTSLVSVNRRRLCCSVNVAKSG